MKTFKRSCDNRDRNHRILEYMLKQVYERENRTRDITDPQQESTYIMKETTVSVFLYCICVFTIYVSLYNSSSLFYLLRGGSVNTMLSFWKMLNFLQIKYMMCKWLSHVTVITSSHQSENKLFSLLYVLDI
jgi:hypothetical protein